MARKTSKYWLVTTWTIGLAMVLLVVIAGCHKDSPKASSSSPSPYVNTRCPIMGTDIDPANVPANLVREYKGQKVAFCCGGCPAAWDKLSDSEKDEKLAKAK